MSDAEAALTPTGEPGAGNPGEPTLITMPPGRLALWRGVSGERKVPLPDASPPDRFSKLLGENPALGIAGGFLAGVIAGLLVSALSDRNHAHVDDIDDDGGGNKEDCPPEIVGESSPAPLILHDFATAVAQKTANMLARKLL